MCVVSNIGDNFRDKIWPGIKPQIWPNDYFLNKLPEISQEEFDRLRKEVEELKKLLKAAKAYDTATGQKDCEQGDKVALIKRLAKELKVDLEDIFN